MFVVIIVGGKQLVKLQKNTTRWKRKSVIGEMFSQLTYFWKDRVFIVCSFSFTPSTCIRLIDNLTSIESVKIEINNVLLYIRVKRSTRKFKITIINIRVCLKEYKVYNVVNIDIKGFFQQEKCYLECGFIWWSLVQISNAVNTELTWHCLRHRAK